MEIDLDYLRQHFADLSDEALREINRSELVEAARKCYDEELASRKLARQPRAAAPEDIPEEEPEIVDDGTAPEWLDHATCACSFVQTPSGEAGCDADEARTALEAAGIPCHVSLEELPEAEARHGRDHEYRVLVPSARGLEAMAVLDRDVFNPRLESEWRAHFEELSDEDLHSLDPDLICVGLLDRAERLRKVYEDELARRG